MNIPKILANVSSSNIGQRIYAKLLHPSKERLLNEGLPLLSGTVCTGSYIYATAHDKYIPKEQKPILQYQNVINGVAGITISAGLNQWAYKKTEKIIKCLDKRVFKESSNIINGIRIAVPIVITSAVMRLLISSGSVLLSDWYKRFKDFTKNGKPL